MTDQTDRDRIITALYDARRHGLGGMSEAQAVGHMADAVLAALPAVSSAGPAPATDRTAVLLEAADIAEDVALRLRGECLLDQVNGAYEVMSELRRRAGEAQQNGRDRAVAELAQAIRLTREYVGEELLPAIEGWSWYDALRRWAPQELPAEKQPEPAAREAQQDPTQDGEAPCRNPGHRAHPGFTCAEVDQTRPFWEGRWADASVARPGQPETDGQQPEAREWCKCPSCWGWFVEDHPGEDLDELGKDLSWWSGLPEHRDEPADTAQQPKEA